MPNLYPSLESRENRKKLQLRGAPYFQQTEFCRAIGIQVRDCNQYWVARFRNKTGDYVRKRIAIADTYKRPNGKTILSYEQALKAAKKWFEKPQNIERARKPYSFGPTTTINYRFNKAEYTVGNAVLEWVEWKRLQSTQSTYLGIVSRSNYYIIPRLGDVSANSINAHLMRKFSTRLLELPAKPGRSKPRAPQPIESYDGEYLRKRKKTLNQVFSILRGALEMAWENGYIESMRPAKCVKRFKNVDRARVLHLSRDECRAFIEACTPELRQLVLGVLYSGCRKSELLNLRCSDVGRDGYGLYIAPHKSLNPRFVFLPDEGMAFFLSLITNKRSDDFVFSRKDGLSWKYNLRYPFSVAVNVSGIPKNFTFHGLRHTYASQLVQAGAPLIVVADQLGHANINTVSQTYAHLSPQIRESEVRQRFTSIDGIFARKAKRNRKQMKEWRESLHGGNWRTYATIHDLTSAGKTKH